MSSDSFPFLVNRLIAAARSEQNAINMFEEALGKMNGTNRTDMRCADIIQRFGRLTAGELAEETGLTTGAITTIIDRLEKAGIARRVRDTSDRRKVFVELTDFARDVSDITFAPMGEAFDMAMKGISKEELRVIAHYLEFTARLNRAYARLLERHAAPAKSDEKALLERAQSFAQAARALNDELAASWGEEPDTPPVAGKGPLPAGPGHGAADEKAKPK